MKVAGTRQRGKKIQDVEEGIWEVLKGTQPIVPTTQARGCSRICDGDIDNSAPDS